MSKKSVPFNHPWSEDLIANVGTVTVGGTPRTSVDKYWNGDVPWMTSGDVHLKKVLDVPSRISELGLRSSNATMVEPPAVAVGLAGQGKTRGTVALIKCYLCTNQSVALIKCDRKTLEAGYLFYNLEFRYEELRSRSAGGGRAGLSKNILEQVPIPRPSRPEQTKIAEVLSTVDRAIEQAEALIAKQQRIKTGLMQDLLTRGIDEHGNLRSEETHEFKDSPLGRIPVEWWVSSVEAEFSLSTGFTLGEHRRPHKNRHPYLRVANVQRERVVLDEVFELEAKDAEVLGRSLEENDLLIVEGHASADEIGRCACVPSEAVGMTFQNHLFRLRCRRLHPRFALAWLNGEWMRAHWRRRSGTSSGLNTINSTALKAVPILVPSVEEQERIAEVLDAHDVRIRAEEAYHDKLKLQKKGLMQDLLTGEKRVTPLLEADGEGMEGSAP